MRSYLPFVLDTTFLFILAFVFITQIIIPLWIDLTIFWLFKKSGRAEANRRFRKAVGYPPKPAVSEEKWCRICLVRHAEGKHVHPGRPQTDKSKTEKGK